jgi:hypothetical protein
MTPVRLLEFKGWRYTVVEHVSYATIHPVQEEQIVAQG